MNPYVEAPTIPAEMTVAEYRRLRPRRVSWFRRLVRRRRGRRSPV